MAMFEPLSFRGLQDLARIAHHDVNFVGGLPSIQQP